MTEKNLKHREHAEYHNMTNSCGWFSVLFMLYLSAILPGVFVLGFVASFLYLGLKNNVPVHKTSYR
jgi:hypothetical protein